MRRRMKTKTKGRGRASEHEICVITWNVNKSSAHYDFLSNMAQCQANVVMGGETNLEEYYKTLKEIDKNMQEIKQEYQISGIITGMDAQVEVKPHQERSVERGTRMSRGKTAKFCELESKFEGLVMELIM